MIKIKHLRLRSITIQHVYGADISFESGLNVIRAGNTSGKSTCLQSIIYGLGLERSLGPQLAIPLPYAMRERIHPAKDAAYELVIQSYVEIELENTKGVSLVVHRDIVGGNDIKLIRTWSSPSLSTDAERSAPKDYYIHDAGSAQRADGFHHFLAEFIGWELPVVPKFDGTESPLYLETIFPMLFVEQKRGWSAIQGPFPTFLKIQDISRRVMEFLLELESAHLRNRRAELRRAIQAEEDAWRRLRETLYDRARTIGRIKGIAQSPTAEFAKDGRFDLELFHEGEWITIETVITEYNSKITSLEGVESQSTEDALPEIQQQISVIWEEIERLSATLQSLRSEYAADKDEVIAIRKRLSSLREDLHRNQDALKLKKLGSELGSAAGDHVCPTCHQGLAAELMPVIASAGMGLEENIQFIKSQIEIFEVSDATSSNQLNESYARSGYTETQLREKQGKYRALLQELSRPSKSPTLAILQEIVLRKNFVGQLNSLLEAANGYGDELQEIAKNWSTLKTDLARLTSDNLTPKDLQKIDSFQSLIRLQLTQYGFSSFMPSEIFLSSDNFRPLRHELDNGETIEKEINFEISASDHIRLKWAYYLALLELSNTYQTNHAGVVIFDEPGQQEIEAKDLFSFLKRTSHIVKQQVIVATSESLSNVDNALAGSMANIVNFDGHILRPI